MSIRTPILVAIGCIALVSCIASEVVQALLLGWVVFLWNVLPRVSVDRPTLVLAGVAFGLFVAGIHGFGMAWSWSRAGEGVARRRWRLRWSLAAGVLVAVLFAAGISLVGIVHQTAWLSTSDKPLYGPVLKHAPGGPDGAAINLKMIALGTHNYCTFLEISNNDRELTARSCLVNANPGGGR